MPSNIYIYIYYIDQYSMVTLNRVSYINYIALAIGPFLGHQGEARRESGPQPHGLAKDPALPRLECWLSCMNRSRNGSTTE